MLDLRLPVGVFFLIVGAILGIHGLVSPHVVEGYVLDKDWGAFLLVFGAVMTYFGWRGQIAGDAEEKAEAIKTASG